MELKSNAFAKANSTPKKAPKKPQSEFLDAGVVTTPTEPESAAEKPTEAHSAVLEAALKKKAKPVKSSNAYYLSKKNQDWLKRTAKKAGLSVSELLDQILDEVSQH